MFVERNDRHIILEPEHEIGDLKVSCVRYVQQNGGTEIKKNWNQQIVSDLRYNHFVDKNNVILCVHVHIKYK